MLLASISSYSPLYALSCNYDTINDKYNLAVYVFSGTVVAVEDEIEVASSIPPQYLIYHQKVTYKVFSLWKGDVSDFVEIYYQRDPLIFE